MVNAIRPVRALVRCRVGSRWPRPGRQERAWPRWSSDTRNGSAELGADPVRSGLWRLGRIPRCASVVRQGHHGDQRYRAWSIAAQVGQFPGGIVAADQQMLDTGVGVISASRRNQARSTGVGRGAQHRRSVSARRVPGSARAAHRRGSDRHRWARAGWPPPPARSPDRDHERPPAIGGGAIDCVDRPPMAPRELWRRQHGRSA